MDRKSEKIWIIEGGREDQIQKKGATEEVFAMFTNEGLYILLIYYP